MRHGTVTQDNDTHDMTKALFFDIDGTLVSFATHAIPPSAVEALERAKRGGAKIFISTGRPMRFINNLKPIEHLIDGYMTTNGGCCMIGDRTVSLHPIAPDDVATVLDACRRTHTGCVVVGKEKISALYPEKMAYIMNALLQIPYEQWIAPLDEVVGHDDILQLTPFFTAAQEAEVLPLLHSVTSARWYPDFTDITARKADKGQGLVAMARAEGIDIADTMAFGDGGNDLPILRQAGTGVAMGNAGDDVKAAAQYVTASVDDDGIMKALQHFGII